MFIVLVNNKYYVRKYEQDLFGGGLVHFTNNEHGAAKMPEMVAREVASGLREVKKSVIIKKVK